MKLVKLDIGGIVRTLLGVTPPKAAGDAALIKIVVQVIRAAK